MEQGCICFYSPYGDSIAIHQPTGDKSIIFLDCNLLYGTGLPDFEREWKNGTNLYDYVINVCYPVLRNIKGACSVKSQPEIVINEINNILKDNNIDYLFSEKTNIEYTMVSPYRSKFNNLIPYNLFSFKYNEVHYGIILKQSNSIYLARFKDDGKNNVFFEYPWHSFCPIYKGGKDYIQTTVLNFLEFIQEDSKKDI